MLTAEVAMLWYLASLTCVNTVNVKTLDEAVIFRFLIGPLGNYISK